MDRFEELSERLAVVTDQIGVLVQVAKRGGFNQEGARDLEGPLKAVAALMGHCADNKVSPEFLEFTLRKCDKLVPKILAAITTKGGIA